jgi:hypothetical protein
VGEDKAACEEDFFDLRASEARAREFKRDEIGSRSNLKVRLKKISNAQLDPQVPSPLSPHLLGIQRHIPRQHKCL